MSHSVPPLSDEVRRLIEVERAAPPASAALRTRALSRAAGALGAMSTAPARSHFRARWTLLAAALGVVVALGAFAAYRSGEEPASPGEARHASTGGTGLAPVAPRLSAPSAEAAQTDPPSVAPSAAPAPPVAVQRPSAEDNQAAELALLQRARAALARGDGSGALAAISEHQRRFSNGRLREEREALRVKALTKLGRGDEARRAAERFKTEFPRSVLSSSIEQTAKPGR